MLIVTGIGLLWIRKQPEGPTEYFNINWKQALAIGCFQALEFCRHQSQWLNHLCRPIVWTQPKLCCYIFLSTGDTCHFGATVLELKDLGEASPMACQDFIFSAERRSALS